MLKPFRLLVALAFVGHTLTAPFWVFCDAPGPDGHQRVEFLLGGRCGEHVSHPPSSRPDGAPSSAISGCCGDCSDESLPQQPTNFVQTFSDTSPAFLFIVPPPPRVLPAVLVLGMFQGSSLTPDHPGDPPLFLTQRNFRI